MLIAALVSVAALAMGCGAAPPSQTSGRGDSEACISDFDPNRDYYPTKLSTRYAENFSIQYRNSYQVLTVDEPYPGADPVRYVLLHCGAPQPELPGELASAPVIETPIDSLYSASTTHVPLVLELGQLEVLAGVADGADILNTEIRSRIDSGEIVEYAAGNTIDVEEVASASPDVLMTGGIDQEEYASLHQAGVGVVANAEWLEATPLGRAEWVKVMAALTGTEKQAQTVFSRIVSEYEQIAATVADAEPVPVLPGTMYEGRWSMPGGGSYVAALLKDAGATYPWAGTNTNGSLELSFAEVYAEAGDTPLWLADAAGWKNPDDITAEDPRYGNLAAVAAGQVWNNNRAAGASGGNAYWTRGVTHPNEVLADLVAITHPEALDDHEFTFYQRIDQ